jgi:nitroimidazol reductase NimA-like FMN-containing flavoprotein (pyridoxamine 5'-phosphate oxidase superfamily)
MPRTAKGPTYAELTKAEARALLRRNNVGRLCFINGNAVDVEPVHYVHRDSWIFVRSAFGTKMLALAHNPFVAFEFDEVQGLFDWRSVVVKGTVYRLDREGTPIEQREYRRAVRALRTLVPQAFGPDDPTPALAIVYGIHASETIGRKAEHRGRSGVGSGTRSARTHGMTGR